MNPHFADRDILTLARKYLRNQEKLDATAEFIDVNERGVAFNYLCGVLEEEEIAISMIDYELLAELGKWLGEDERVWIAVRPPW